MDHNYKSNLSKKEPVAIIGIGCRFPGGADSPEKFWELLTQGFDAIDNVPSDRWNTEEFYDPDPQKAGKIKVQKGGFLKNIDRFDADFFNIFPKEAEQIDPQQRILLEVTYEALENAGLPLEKFKGSRTSVFMGVFMNDFWDMQVASQNREHISPHVAMGAARTSVANRLSYVFNLKGGSVALDTACSSSLVGVHLACQSIWNHEADMAVAGGVNVMIRPETSILMSKGGFLCPDGYCKSFDAAANGYVRSEGAGVILLKPLSKALADGDRVHAVIRGSAINQDGHTAEGYTVPSLDSQVNMLKAAYKDAGITPDQVHYIEAHGTGTPVGDPIETKAFGEFFGKAKTEYSPLVIGSVKSNIGHTEAAAGIAGLIKLTMALQKRQIPKNLHFNNPNPKIPFGQYKLKVPVDHMIWPAGDVPAIGGVNSFGAGGTNAHVVLEEFKQTEQKEMDTDSEGEAKVIFLSAKNKAALKDQASKYAAFLKDTPAALHEVCAMTLHRKSKLDYQIVASAFSKEEMADILKAWSQGEMNRQIVEIYEPTNGEIKLGFIFSGQGPQWYAMGRELFDVDPVFRATVFQIESEFKELAGWSLIEEMLKSEEESRVSETRIAQPAIMAVQIGLAEMWRSRGVSPQGVVGHSIGEVAAAYAAGALTLRQAVEVIYNRSKEQDRASGKGKMLAVGLSHEEGTKLIERFEEFVSIAAVNGPKMLTLSGDTEVLDILAKRIDEQGIFYRFLRVNVPFHSHHMEPLKEELIHSLAHLQPAKAEIDLYSTVSGQKEDGTHLNSEYWFRNVRKPVYFANALEKMVEDGFNTFIEIAPHPVLTSGVKQLFESLQKTAVIWPSIRRDVNEPLQFDLSMAALYCQGYPVEKSTFYPPLNVWVDLPAYTWQSERFWFETEEMQAFRLGSRLHPFLKHYTKAVAGQLIWDVDINRLTQPFVADHRVENTIVFPATGHLEIAHTVGVASFGAKYDFLEDIYFEKALYIPEEEEVAVRLEIKPEEDSFVLSGKAKASSELDWTPHSFGKFRFTGSPFVSGPQDFERIKELVTEKVDAELLYGQLKNEGLVYGNTFKCIKELWVSDHEVLASIHLHESLRFGSGKFSIHPTLLDAALHSIFAAKPAEDDEQRGIYLPEYIRRYKFYKKPGYKVWSYIQLSEVSDQYLKGNLWVFDEQGELVAEIQGLSCRYVEGSRGESAEDLYKGTYNYEWKKQENTSAEAENDKGLTVIFSDKKGKGQQLADLLSATGEKVLMVYPQLDELKNVHHSFSNAGFTVFEHQKETGFRQIDQNSFSISPENKDNFRRLFGALQNQEAPFKRLVFLWGAAEICKADTPFHELESQQQWLNMAFINLLKSVIQLENAPECWLLTQYAQSLTDEQKPVNLVQAALYGIARVMYNEYPFISMKMIDMSAGFIASECEKCAEILTNANDPCRKHAELALRDGEVFYKVLEEVNALKTEIESTKTVGASGSDYQVTVDQPGDMNSVRIRESQHVSVGKDEVRIKVIAAGVNSKDLMFVMGLLPADEVEQGIYGENLGQECAGIVSEIGEEVTEFKVGDEVMAWAKNSLSGLTVAKKHCVVHKPGYMSFEQGATVFEDFLTAYYCLKELVDLKAGDKVLIHTSVGGVGLSAIKLALWCGAEVYATADTEEKREYLKTYGVKHVFDLDDPAFADELMKVSQNKGVRVVLNTLFGTNVKASLKCLADFGAFIEVSKTDQFRDARLSLSRLGNNASYHMVNIDRLMSERPELGKSILLKVLELFNEKALTVNTFKEFPVSAVYEAFKMMKDDKPIGNVLVSMHEDELNVLPANTLNFSRGAAYLITGGASGLGLELAVWLASKGAGHLVLVSRSGPKTEHDRKQIQEMEEAGVRVIVVSADITDEQKIKKLIHLVDQDLAPLKGIFHCAAILEDATLPNMDNDRFMRVFRAKAMGAWNLHQSSLELSLEHFVMMSSVSSIFGIPGQANYAAANAFLDQLAFFRRGHGLPASSVNLGLLGQFAGMSRGDEQVLNVLKNQGWKVLTLKQVTDKLEKMIVQKVPQRMLGSFDPLKLRDFFPHLTQDTRFATLLENRVEKSQKKSRILTLKDELWEQNVAIREEILQRNLQEALAKILGYATDKLDINKSISSLGLDSLMLNQLRNWIKQKLEVNWSLIKIAKGPSISELTTDLLAALFQEEKTEETTPAAPEKIHESVAQASGPAPVKQVETLEEDEQFELINRWLLHSREHTQQGNIRLFCLHPVGAGASMFYHFLAHPPKGTDVYAIQLPGREQRQDEPFYQNVDQLVKDMAEAILPLLDRPFAIFGHSFGGIIGYELIRYLKENHQKEAIHLFVSGTVAPQLTAGWKDKEVISETADEQNTEAKLLGLLNYIDDIDFLRRILPVMKKDMPLIMNYAYNGGKELSCSVTAFGAVKDEIVLLDEVKAWEYQTAGRFSFHEVNGDHWFLSRNQDKIMEVVNNTLIRYRLNLV